jgi:hypothetical protein
VKEFFDTWSKPKAKTGFGAGTPQMQMERVHADGIGDHDGYFIATVRGGGDHGWMG